MGANGAKKSWLDRMFRGDAVSDEAYGAREEEPEQEEEKEAALDGTYARRPQVQSTARRDNVVDFAGRAQARASASAGKTGDAPGSFSRASTVYPPRESAPPAREFGGGSGGGSGSGGGFGMGAGMAGQSGSGDAYVIFKRLKDFTTATQVADRMTEHKIVILNLESCDDETARRVLDFIGGVAYACTSMVKRIAGRVFMITPKGVSADGEFFDEVKGSVEGIYDD